MIRFSLFYTPIFIFLAFFLCPVFAEQHSPTWIYVLGEDLETKDLSYWQAYLRANVTICFTGTVIQSDAKVRYNSPPDKLLALGLSKGVRWIPLITFKSKTGTSLLRVGAKKHAMQKALLDFLSEHPTYAGIHLDVEGLPSSLSGEFKNFLMELRPGLRKKGKLLTLALFPQIHFPADLAEFHKDVFHTNLADEVVLMAYDFHSPRTKPGPVTRLSWAKENIALLRKTYDPNQIWLGLPLYGYSWKKGRSKPKVISRKKDSVRMAKSGRNEDGIYIVENEFEVSSLILDETDWIKLSRETGIAGIAYWRFGF
ncbi:glycoside hydrolase, family 18 domain protein [Leptospira inadai serovar Lyme str. 10]|uniref:Glycoside hydrolase, family 18 domain protein n=2 Tax=Leptospira inadai serovar Lyme TaxID=293084 RepID=V6H832_9LEPT|nr:glycosyl hydrolase family 18 protein [Leptospira inadai]EQA34971.1 glycoside hydrolase, family 18 domain protein [Leptospira inadai serovar Lyme str. 10]PNV75424.1 glycoside hydrolase, family 18 domain protein [Leptospira inadai serovar Lyme]